MEPMRLRRHLRLRNLEAFRIRRGFLGPTICFLLIADHGRPSTLDDFPYLKGVESPEEVGRPNFIQVIVLSAQPLPAAEREEIVNIAGGLIEADGGCDWNAVFEVLSDEEVRFMEESQSAMLTCFERILGRHDFPVDIANISQDSWSRLSQD